MTASEIQKLTPKLLSAADMASGRGGDTSATTEHLNLLSQEWATKVCMVLWPHSLLRPDILQSSKVHLLPACLIVVVYEDLSIRENHKHKTCITWSIVTCILSRRTISLQAKVLMRGVDDVSLGMSGPADTLLLSARSGDPTLLSEQGRAITELASSLGNIARDALEG